jgi:N-acetylmuramoyl-L-alanine amidase
MSLLIGLVLSLSACAEKPPHYERIVVIDPGHGGVDPGATGGSGNILEKEVALRTGLALRDQLEATGRYRVIMTRDDDRMVQLRDRLQIARRSEGELFISLHADSLVTAPEVGGASVYTLSESPSYDDPAPLLGKEKRPQMLASMDLSNQDDVVPETLLDLAQRATNNKSIRLAELLVQELNGLSTIARLRRAGFVVLRSPDMPSVLIELGYLSNPLEEKALADDAHIARLARAVARAVDEYFEIEAS